MKRLAGKVAVVTGASRGIGAAIARRLAADGAAVVVNYAKSAKAANELVAEITSAGGTASAAQADVSDSAQVRGLFDSVKRRHGHVDILVNNAGVFDGAPLVEATVEHLRSVFDINVQGPLVVTREALAHFPTTGGRVINISSVVARAPMAGSSVYSASKAALEAFTQAWAWELAPRKVTVNSVAPGLTASDMTSPMPEEFRSGVVARTPLGRIGQPNDIADVVAFVASEEARWITGQSILASGGLIA